MCLLQGMGPMKKICLAICAIALVGFGASGKSMAATLTLSLSSVTNDYRGPITLTITGIVPGQTVRIEKFVDMNANGVIDSSEPGIAAFTVTDGQVATIGGVRNHNVPGDEDGAANGQITCKLPYPGLDESLDCIAAHYIFKLSDPLAVFPPVTQPFVVTQKTYPQGVTGQLTAAGSVTPLSNALVVLVDPNGNRGLTGTQTDANGNFTLYALPGNYTVVPVDPGYVADFGAGSAAVTSNTFTTKNLTMTVSDRTLSGSVTDASTGAGLPRIFLQAQTQNNLFAGSFTDSAGFLDIPVTSSVWRVSAGDEVMELGYVGMNGDSGTIADATSGSVTNVQVTLPKATAMIYGTVTDDLGNAISGIHMQANPQNGSYNASGRSSNSGKYSLGVIPGTWYASPTQEDLAAGGWVTQNPSITIASGQAIQQNFILRHSTAHINGTLKDSSNNALSGINVYAFSTISGVSYNSNATTASDGSFQLAVLDGTWQVGVDCSGLAPKSLSCVPNQSVTISGSDQTVSFVAYPVGAAVPAVTDDGAYTTNLTQLHAAWSYSDPVNGVAAEYRYAIGTSQTDQGTGYIVPWQSTGLTTSVTRTGLSLNPGQTYYFYVQAKNGLGVWSQSGSSDGITAVSQVSTSPGAAKLLANGTAAGITGVVVTGTPSEMGGMTIVEAPDRSSGLTIQSNAPFVEGDILNAGGVMGTLLSGERVLTGASVQLTGHQNPIVPLGMSLRNVASGPFFYDPSTGAGQRGLTSAGGSFLSTIGLLVRVSGKVTAVDPSFLTVDDGSWPVAGGIKVDRTNLPNPVSPLDYVSVTGISSLTMSSGSYEAVIRPRTSPDLVVLVPAVP